MSNKSKINYGDVDQIGDDELDMKKAKIRITTMIDYPVYEKLKEMAEADGTKYQTLINNILRAYVTDPAVPQFINGKKWHDEALQNFINQLELRVENIEKKIG